MPVRITIKLILLDNALVRAHKAPGHGWFLALADALDPAWARVLHDDEQRTPDGRRPAQIIRPYCVSPFHNAESYLLAPAPERLPRHEPPGLTIPKGETIALTVCLLDESRALFLLSALQQKRVALPPLGGAVVELNHISWDVETWEQLAQTPVAESVILRFLTPTVFESQGVAKLFPEPKTLWEGWARTWERHAPLPLPGSLEALEDSSSLPIVTDYQLHTAPVLLERALYRGFLGEVTFTCPQKTTGAGRQTAAILARLAPFCGAGRKTTMGLGQITLL